MIISHSRKFIFIKTFKTGGSSLEIALSKYCGKGDILTELDPPEEALRRERYGIGAQMELFGYDRERKPGVALRAG